MFSLTKALQQTHVLKETINLQDLLSNVAIGTPHFLHVYCGVLVLTGGNGTIDFRGLRWLRLFACSIQCELGEVTLK